ncbi:hypothetical protein [Hydrogenimonas sp.]
MQKTTPDPFSTTTPFLLHAAFISFIHPENGSRLTIEAPLPPEFLVAFV